MYKPTCELDEIYLILFHFLGFFIFITINGLKFKNALLQHLPDTGSPCPQLV